jgi:hypothetical protein
MFANVPVPATAASSGRDRLIPEREAAALLGYSPRALQNWRLRGGGPVFVKVSERSIRYQHSDLMAWIASRRRARTADPGRRQGIDPPRVRSAARKPISGLNRSALLGPRGRGLSAVYGSARRFMPLVNPRG